MGDRGAIAAGHPLTARTGADVLAAGGNAVDAALAAMGMSMIAEPVLTGLGAGGYMMVVAPGEAPTLIDFFVEAPGRGGDPSQRVALEPVEVDFGDAVQIFNVGPASCGAYGVPAGMAHAWSRFGSRPLAELMAPAAAAAREGVPLNGIQAYVLHILEGVMLSTPEAAALLAPGGSALAEGETHRNPDLAEALELLAAEGAEPFYRGVVAERVIAHLDGRGAMLTADDLAAYEAIERTPISVAYRGRRMLTNPPPSAGGTLIAYALALLEREPRPPGLAAIVAAMEAAQAERTIEFLEGLGAPGFGERFLASRLGSTTHISVLDCDGMACSVTCSNGECSGIVVPGTGVHLNNMMGEQDLSPAGFHTHAPGTRMPSMMSPTVVMRAEEPELVLGSAGSNRIRSAIVQAIIGVVDHELSVGEAIEAPRIHFEDGIVYSEPGIDLAQIEHLGHGVAPFRAANLFFGGVNAVGRDLDGSFAAAADPRRGGGAALA